jgi:hypothetical protein
MERPVNEYLPQDDKAIVKGCPADGEYEVKWCAAEKLADIVAHGLRPREADNDGKKDEECGGMFEYIQQQCE